MTIPAEQNSKRKIQEIFNAADPQTVVQGLSATDLYTIIQEVGLENSFELFQFATIEQARIILDLDLWEEWSISLEQTVNWLDLILSAGDDFALRILESIDQELLIILLKKVLTVGGGVADIINSEDLKYDWDHTFDEVFYLRIDNDEHSEPIMKMLELLHRENHPLYRALLLGAESELLTELEETAYQFRTARLEEEGIRVEY